jgi:transcriptional regulator with XRE-family HTH domain
MTFSDRLRAIREAKQLSEGDIEERTGLLQSYVSGVENGHAVPTIEALEKWAGALEVPVHQLFCNEEEPPMLPIHHGRLSAHEISRGGSGKVDSRNQRTSSDRAK